MKRIIIGRVIYRNQTQTCIKYGAWRNLFFFIAMWNSCYHIHKHTNILAYSVVVMDEYKS